MINIAKAEREIREDLFLNTGYKNNMNPAIVEKDFWVCYMLDFLFHRFRWKDAFVFKGGTSLSKAYKAIERFSEDMDLILDWRLIDYSDEDAWAERSKTKQDKYDKNMIRDASDFLSGQFIEELRNELSQELEKEVHIEMDPNDKDQCTVNFYYDHIFDDTYLRPEIRLEIGPLAEWTPSHECAINSFAAEVYPQVFDKPETQIRTVDVERTFWEKVLILHKTAFSCEEKGIPARYARHYYDVYCLVKAGVKERAFQDTSLLERDVAFKQKFYYMKNARYDLAKPGSFMLVPRDSKSISILSSDYDHMKGMIYGDIPEFDTILSRIQTLENELNELV